MTSTGAYRATYRTRTYNRKGRVARTQPVPGMRHEQALLAEGATLVGGIDEVGVGGGPAPPPATPCSASSLPGTPSTTSLRIGA